MKVIAAALALLALGACADPQSRYYATDSQTYIRDLFGPRYQVTVAPIYCYSTLGDPDCYAAPVAGWEHRLIAQYGPRAY
jgi:hypothetical protein